MSEERLPWWRCLPAWPLLWYTRWPGAPRGRRFLGTSILPRLLPARGRFQFRHRNGPAVELEYADALGSQAFIFGGFEPAEIAALLARLRPGDTAFDVGANIGFHTVALAQGVGPTGRVIAVEPVPANAAAVRANLARNGLVNVQVVEAAAGAVHGEIELELTRDPAFVSAHGAVGGGPAGKRLRVPLEPLDQVWQAAGSPLVRVMKIDTEGAELEGLQGAERLLRTCRPALLLEANDEARRRVLDEHLFPRGYRRTQPPGFEPWNYLYEAAEGA